MLCQKQQNTMNLGNMVSQANSHFFSHIILFLYLGASSFLSTLLLSILYWIFANYLVFGWQSICYHVIKKREITVLDAFFGGYLIDLKITIKMFFLHSFCAVAQFIFITVLSAQLSTVFTQSVNSIVIIIMYFISNIYLSQINFLLIQNRYSFFKIPQRSINIIQGHVLQYLFLVILNSIFAFSKSLFPFLCFYFEPVLHLVNALFFIKISEEKQIQENISNKNPYPQQNKNYGKQQYQRSHYSSSFNEQQNTSNYRTSQDIYSTSQKRQNDSQYHLQQIPQYNQRKSHQEQSHQFRSYTKPFADEEKAKKKSVSDVSSSVSIKQSMFSSLSQFSRSFSRDSDDSYKAFIRQKEKEDKIKLDQAKSKLRKEEKRRRREKQMQMERQMQIERHEKNEWQRKQRQKSKKKKKVIKQIITLEESSQN